MFGIQNYQREPEKVCQKVFGQKVLFTLLFLNKRLTFYFLNEGSFFFQTLSKNVVLYFLKQIKVKSAFHRHRLCIGCDLI